MQHRQFVQFVQSFTATNECKIIRSFIREPDYAHRIVADHDRNHIRRPTAELYRDNPSYHKTEAEGILLCILVQREKV